MSDNINRADAIEAVDERWGDIKRTNKRVAKGHEAVYLDMRATISALPSADAEWILCSERLPEYRETVIISTFWGVKTGYLDSTEAYGDFWEIIEEDGDTALHNVYAWMPLPKPYKGGEDK